MGCFSAFPSHDSFICDLILAGQENVEYGARGAIVSRSDVDAAPVSLHDFFCTPEAQAGANVLLCRKERLEDPLQILSGNPGSIVRNRHMNHLLFRQKSDV